MVDAGLARQVHSYIFTLMGSLLLPIIYLGVRAVLG
jgi:hypothetical protein